MTYHVRVQRLALKDLMDTYHHVAGHPPQSAERWLKRFEAALGTLEHDPQRCPLALENGKVEIEVRELHFGRRPNVFRVIFTIDGRR